MPVSSQALRWLDGPYAALNVTHLRQRASSARRGSDGLQVRRSGGPRWRTAWRGLPFAMRSACGVACLHHRALGMDRGDGSHRDRPSMPILTDVRPGRGKLDVVGLPLGEAEPMRLPVRVAPGVRVAPRHIHPVHAAGHRPGMRPESARVSSLAAGLVRGAPSFDRWSRDGIHSRRAPASPTPRVMRRKSAPSLRRFAMLSGLWKRKRSCYGAPSRRGAPRRGGRAVECTALEMRHACKGIGGSNPPLSAIQLRQVVVFIALKQST